MRSERLWKWLLNEEKKKNREKAEGDSQGGKEGGGGGGGGGEGDREGVGKELDVKRQLETLRE